jgi:KUP system potassium uptake protein
VVFGVVFGGTELTFFAANLTKVVHGGWLPLVIAVAIVSVMVTWQRGRRIITQRRMDLEGDLQVFVEKIRTKKIQRVPGLAVFPHPTKETTPLALRANVEFNHVLHERVVIVLVRSENVPHVPEDDRISVDELGYSDDGIVHLALRFGFQDEQDIPAMLRRAVGMSPELDFDPDTASYFLSRIAIERSARNDTEPRMATWRKRLFVGLAHNAASPAAYFCLPFDRTVSMASRVEL